MRWLDQIIRWLKPSSIAWRTTLLVAMVALFSQFAVFAFLWKTFYAPELREHGEVIAEQIIILNHALDLHVKHSEEQVEAFDLPLEESLVDWQLRHLDIELVSDPSRFPRIKQKIVASFFTQHVEKAIERKLNSDVVVYFQFKPSPQLWIKSEYLPNVWVHEPLDAYADYQLEVILLWLLGAPIIMVWIILILVRQLNRPLSRLQEAAQRYTFNQDAPVLDTNHGSIEIKQVNRAFNQMIARITQVDEERKVMLGGISHDLRTPLTRMRLLTEFMQDEMVKQDFIQDIEEMDQILGQFLAYIQSGEDEASEWVDFSQLLQDVLHNYRGLTIKTDVPVGQRILLKPLSMKRVLNNLLTNAEKYGAEPIYISSQLNNEVWQLTVADTGKEVAVHTTVDTLFNPFVRGDAARTQQGTGLGLAIVERIIKLHGGRVKAHINETNGFTVTMRVPQ